MVSVIATFTHTNGEYNLLLARAEAEEDRFLRLKLRGSNKCAGDDEGHGDDAHRQSKLPSTKCKDFISSCILRPNRPTQLGDKTRSDKTYIAAGCNLKGIRRTLSVERTGWV